jgi:hypothetical protein
MGSRVLKWVLEGLSTNPLYFVEISHILDLRSINQQEEIEGLISGKHQSRGFEGEREHMGAEKDFFSCA